MRYQTPYRRDYQKFESDQDGGQPHHDEWEIHPFARERFDEIKKGVSKVDGVFWTSFSINLAMEIVKQANEKYGVTPDQILIDVNAYPIGSESVEGLNFCAETLKSLPRIKIIHPDLKTSIGIGNLTNGLANKPYMRKVLTSVFLDEARKAGLDCAILNPNHYVPLESLPDEDVKLALKVILERDMNAFDQLEEIALTKKTGIKQKKVDYADLSTEESVCTKIKDGFKQKEEGTIKKNGAAFSYRDHIVLEVSEITDRHEPLDFISGYLMKTMRD